MSFNGRPRRDYSTPLMSTSVPQKAISLTKRYGTTARKPVPVRDISLLGTVQQILPHNTEYSALAREDEDAVHDAARAVQSKQTSTNARLLDTDHAAVVKEYLSWTPLVLRLPWLSSILAFGAALLVVVGILHAQSVNNNGLLDDNGRAALFFGWHFVPTLLAVTYVITLMILLDAAKETESMARLTHSTTSSASATILRSPGAWWTALADSFPRKSNDSHPSWTMLCAAVAYVLGFLVLSPFSSALLTSKDVAFTHSTTFESIKLDSSPTVQLNLDTSDYFQTIGHILQDVITSPWISDEYVVLPFWPSLSSRPSGAKFLDIGQTWNANGAVFQSELVCEELNLLSGPTTINYTWTSPDHNGTLYWNMTTLLLASKSGCEYGFGYDASSYTYNSTLGVAHWSSLSNITIDQFIGSYYFDYHTGNEQLLLNHTAECEPGEVVIVLAAHVGGLICRPSYYTATLPVTVSGGADATMITFDRNEFLELRSPISAEMVNITGFQDTFLSMIWSKYMVSAISPYLRPDLGGPVHLLAVLYDFDMNKMLADPDLALKANKIKQRAFGQGLYASLSGLPTVDSTSGKTITVQRRIVVVQVVAYIIEVVLVLIFLLLLGVVWFSHPHRRPLGLSQDAAFTNTIATLISTQSETKRHLREVSATPISELKKSMNHMTCSISRGGLQVHRSQPKESVTLERRSNSAVINPSSRWNPKILSAWAIGALGCSLVAVLLTIAFLYWYSRQHGLYQSAFVYQITIGSSENSLGTLAPYSIIPTLLAVVVGLWWGALETVFRVTQPFIFISGLGSYKSCLTSTLVTGSDLYWSISFTVTIAMSALWQREPYKIDSNVVAPQVFQLREVAHVYGSEQMDFLSYKSTILANVFQNLMTNWMYGAAIQLSLNGSEPSWSSDGWSFVPVTIPSFEVHNGQNDTDGTAITITQKTFNATLNVQAISARMECTAISQQLDNEYWLTEYDLTNTTVWNTTSISQSPYIYGYELGCDQTTNEALINFQPNTSASAAKCDYLDSVTTVHPGHVSIICCANETDSGSGTGTDLGLASVGYWSPVWSLSGDDPLNFTVKWIHGRAIERYMQNSTTPRLIWPDPPQMALLNCRPVINSANAKVTVDISTGSVQHYEIMDAPTSYDLAWADPFARRKCPSGGYCGTGHNYTVTFGQMFFAALLSATQLETLGGCQTSYEYCQHEDLEDRTFNIRQPGLNVDYMSYSMLSMAQGDPTALLDLGTLQRLANKTFSTFFQHFASSNVSMDGSGGWVYQRPNETLPADLPRPDLFSEDFNWTGIIAPAKALHIINATTNVQISQPVEILRISPLAVWLCLIILAYLIVTTILILLLKTRYFSPLLRGVDTIADMAIMVAGSERYLELARQKGASGLRADKKVRTRLGWFRTESGEVRWGIELADDDRVEFLSDEEVRGLREGREKQEGPEGAEAAGVRP